MGHSEEEIKEGRKQRQDFILYHGMFPESIMLHDRTDTAPDFIVTKGGRAYKQKDKTADRPITLHERLNWSSLSFNKNDVRSGKNAPLSRFSQNIGRFFVKFFCPEDGLIYDPFAGHCSRMHIAHSCLRNYIGVDVSHDFMEANQEIAKQLNLEDEGKLLSNNCTITLYEQSSSSVPQVAGNSADYTITSPPYWLLEYYGDEPEQLGKAKTFESFMVLLTEHIRENYRILKPGAYCSWFINDFVLNRKFYCFHAALIEAFQQVGFILHDITIIDLGHPLATAFVNMLIKTKRFAKRHEYACTFRKPE